MQPLALLTVTVYVPGALTMALLVEPIWVAPALKVYELPPPAVSVTLVTAQVSVPLLARLAIGALIS